MHIGLITFQFYCFLDSGAEAIFGERTCEFVEQVVEFVDALLWFASHLVLRRLGVNRSHYCHGLFGYQDVTLIYFDKQRKSENSWLLSRGASIHHKS